MNKLQKLKLKIKIFCKIFNEIGPFESKFVYRIQFGPVVFSATSNRLLENLF